METQSDLKLKTDSLNELIDNSNLALRAVTGKVPGDVGAENSSKIPLK